MFRRSFTLIELMISSTLAILVVVGIQSLLSIGLTSWRTAQEQSDFAGEYLLLHQLIHQGLNTNGFFGDEPPALQCAASYTELLDSPGRRLAFGWGTQTFSIRGDNITTNGQLILRNENNGGIDLALVGALPVAAGDNSSHKIRVWNFNFTLLNPPTLAEGSFTNAGVPAIETDLMTHARGYALRTGLVELSFTLYNDDDLDGTLGLNEYSRNFVFRFSTLGKEGY